ncbi:MAG: O-antigen ligase family protein [Burkholderiales bacterium]|nr:O-antigen ligase family protein [Burkholderiales bacterium]
MSASVDKPIGRWTFYFAIFFTLLPFGAGAEGATEGSTLRQVVWAAIFFSAGIVLIRRPQCWSMAWDSIPKSFIVLLLFVCGSIIWSPEPFVSFKRVIQVVGVTVLAAAMIAGGKGSYRTHRLVTPVLLLGTLLAVAVGGVFRDFAFAPDGFRGFMATKNNFGQLAVLSIVFGISYVVIEKRLRAIYIPLALLGLAGLGLSRSVTSMWALAAVFALVIAPYWFIKASVSWRILAIDLILCVVLGAHAAGVIFGYPTLQESLDAFFRLTQRDITLSGRTYLWQLMWAEIEKHPLLGIGYGGFWLGLKGDSGQISYLVRWGYPGQAHNGYLDILNEIGLVGTVLTLVFIFQHLQNLTRLFRQDVVGGLFHFSIFVLVATMNVAEATILRTTHLWWIVFMTSALEVQHLLNSTPMRARPASSPSRLLPTKRMA